jgi:glycosyltransferase involved in cell wall biosynthesis
MISAIILSFNEEKNIGRCLKSISDLTDDIIIMDSFSTDKTLEICNEYKCRVFQNPFVNQALQFNWALDNAHVKYDWILRLDSDEMLPNKLKDELRYRLGRGSDFNAYYLNRRMYWMNRWLRHGRMYPHNIVRIFRKGFGRYENKEEEHLIINGKVGYMKNDFLEDNRINTLEYFSRKHLRTAESEVKEYFQGLDLNDGITPKFFGPKINRTRWLKINIYTDMPLFVRPVIYFVYRYFFCLGFLDGSEGLIFHVLQAFWYRFYIDARIFEERSKWQHTNIKPTI